MTAPAAAWAALYAAHKDNKKHYYFFQHNAFKGKDKLMALYEGKMATGEFAEPAGHSSLRDESRDCNGDGDGQVDDDDLSITSQQRRAAGITIHINSESESDSARQKIQPTQNPTPADSIPLSDAKNKRKRPAEESPPKEEVKKERSSADKIRAGLDRLSDRAEASNDIRRDALAARMRLVEHTINLSLPPHELAFKTLQKEYPTLVGKLPEEEFNALLLSLEQPLQIGNALSTTSKGRHFCMMSTGPRRDAFAEKLIYGIQDFIYAQKSSSMSARFEDMLGEYGGEVD